jgi:hypothetical protein
MFSMRPGREESSGVSRFASTQAIRAPSWRDLPDSEINSAAVPQAPATKSSMAGGHVIIPGLADAQRYFSQTRTRAQSRAINERS